MRKDFEKRDLNKSAAKRKNILIFGFAGTMVFLLILSAVMSIDMKKAMQAANANDEDLPNIEQMTDEGEVKESWAIAVENHIDQIKLDNEKRVEEMADKVVERLSVQNAANFKRIDGKLERIEGRMDNQDRKIEETRKNEAQLRMQMTTNTMALQEKIEEVDSKASNVKMMPPPPISNGGSKDDGMFADLDIAGIGSGLKDALSPQKGEHLSYSVQTAVNVFPETNNSKAEGELSKEEIEAMNTFEIVTGFTEAYMLTGAYAPLFGGRSGQSGGSGSSGSGQMMSIPVLMEAEGDLIMPNSTIGSIDKCMLIGTSVGNASSSTVDIRLEKMSCLIDGGKKIIDGRIQGWVVSESGTPGLPATMVYRAGDYISRVIASGVLEGLSQGFMNAAAAGNYGGSGTAQIYAGGANGAGQGVSNAFSKLADFYLQLAEATLPMLETKGGRTVSMVVMGGDKFKLRDVNLLDTREVEFYVNEFIGDK